MKSKDKIRQIFPEAYSWYNGLWWDVHENWDRNSPIIGSGTLEIDAWEESEKEINKRLTE